MDVCFLLFLLCLCTLFVPLPGVALQRDADGMSVHARQLLKAEDDKVQPRNKILKHDPTVTDLERGSSGNTELVNNTVHDDPTDNEGKPGSKGADTTSAPPPPPPVDVPPAGKEKENNGTSHHVDKSDDEKENNKALPDKKPDPPVIHCGGSHCEDPKKSVSACLRIPGDSAHKFSLFITNGGDAEVLVKVDVPEYLTADPHQVSVLKDKSETIQFMMDSKFKPSMLDMEAVKNKNITVSTQYGSCEMAVPEDYLPSAAQEQKPLLSFHMPSVTSKVFAYLVALVLVVLLVGTWAGYKCYRKKGGGDVKYQQLEMIVPGQSTPKERVEQSMGVWDEVWDDDWEDTEAVKSSSRLSHNLSSRGLGARRGNKDGWENSWED